ncbi:MAG: AMP-binding protein, partial [Clostridiales bacterium]|nr:AMP-binding protein [Clostridiales bacterium]
MPQIDISHRSALLKGEMTLENLFHTTVSDGHLTAARWLDNDREQALTFAQYKEISYDYADYLQKAIGRERKGRFVAIQMETSYHWFPTFWGLVAAGYQVVLLDASLSDDMTDFMLGQAGAVALVVKNKRSLSHDALQILHEDLFAAKGHEGFMPQFASQVALCTSGTTATSRIFVYDEEAVCHQVLNSELLHRLNPRIVSGNPERSLSFLPYHHVFGFMVN